jgi:hypothetical protein
MVNLSPVLATNDTLKASLKSFSIDTDYWEVLAQGRTGWRGLLLLARDCSCRESERHKHVYTGMATTRTLFRVNQVKSYLYVCLTSCTQYNHTYKHIQVHDRTTASLFSKKISYGKTDSMRQYFALETLIFV